MNGCSHAPMTLHPDRQSLVRISSVTFALHVTALLKELRQAVRRCRFSPRRKSLLSILLLMHAGQGMILLLSLREGKI